MGKSIKTSFTDMLGIDYPVIMAPMFLVSTPEMIIEALKSGITAAFPALNYRTDEDFRNAILKIRKATSKPFGINLIVNKSNIKYKKQLDTCLGIKVFCDVVDLTFALKVAKLGADAVIAVSSKAGGHSGTILPEVLIPMLIEKLDIPVISAGGIATYKQLKEAIESGAQAVSVGTIFIASPEAGVSDEYKNALVEYGAEDIIMTSNISGTPITVINTPYMQKIGNKQGLLSKILSKNKRFKKYIKMFIMARGMKAIENAANKPTYKTVWVAGRSIEYIHSIRPVREIVKELVGA